MPVNRKKIAILSSLALGVLFLIPIIPFIILANINLNHYKPQIETYFYHLTGRTLKLNGKIKFDIINRRLTPKLEIENASISNADWGQKQPMLVMGKLQLQIQLLALMKKILLIDNIQIENTRIIIENNQAGLSNWQLGSNRSTQQPVPTQDNTPSYIHSVLPIIQQLTLKNIKIQYIDKRKLIHTDALIESLSLKEKRNSSSTIKAEGKINNDTFNFGGKISSLSHLLNNDPATVFLHARAADITLRINGTILHPLSNNRLNLSFTLDADNINHTITLITGRKFMSGKLPLHLNGHISSKNKTYSFDRLKLKLANNEINIFASLALQKPVPRLKINLSANTINTRKLKIILNNRRNNSAIRKIENKKQKTAVVYIPALSVRFKQLNTINADISIHIKKIITEKIKTRNNQLEVKLKNGNLIINKLAFNYLQGSVTAKSALMKKNNAMDATLDLHINKLDLASALGSFGITSITKGYLNTNIKLTSSANNLRDLLFQSSGPVVISVSDLETTMRINKNSKPIPVYIPNAALNLLSVKKPLSYSITTKIKNYTLSDRGTLDSLYTLMTGRPYRITSYIDSAGNTGKVNAYFSDPFNPRTFTQQNIKINTDIQIKKSANIINFANFLFPNSDIIKKIPHLPASIQTKIEKSANRLLFTAMKIKIGDSDIHGTVRINTTSKPIFIQSHLSSDYININQILPKIKNSRTTKKADNRKIKPLSGKPFNLTLLKKINSDFSLDINKLDIKSYTINKLHLSALLDKGNLTLNPVSLTFSDGKFTSYIKMMDTNPLKIISSLNIKQMNYGKLLQTMGEDGMVSGKLDANLNLYASGNSPRRLLSSLKGNFIIKTVNGRLSNQTLDLFSKNIASLLPFTNRQDKQRIRCGVASFDIKHGIAKTRAIIFDTGQVSVLGTGEINLNNEKISFYIEPHAKKTSIAKLALIPVNIRGTFFSPSVTPNLAGTTLSTGKSALHIGLGIATGGISLVAEDLTNRVWNTIVDTNDYCAIALSEKPIKVTYISILQPETPVSTPGSTVNTHGDTDDEWEDW